MTSLSMLSGIYRINGVGDRPFLSDGTFIGNSPNLVNDSQNSIDFCSKVNFDTSNPFPDLSLSTAKPSDTIGTICVGNDFRATK